MQIRKEKIRSREVKPLKKKQQQDSRALHTMHDRNDHLLSDFLKIFGIKASTPELQH
jgi:hypothetical protein